MGTLGGSKPPYLLEVLLQLHFAPVFLLDVRKDELDVLALDGFGVALLFFICGCYFLDFPLLHLG